MLTLSIIALIIASAQPVFAYQVYRGKDSADRLAPLKEGTLKILAIGLYPAHYDSIELADRLDAEVIAVRLSHSFRPKEFQRRTVYWRELGVTTEQAAKDALAALAGDYDLIIVTTNPPWDTYPEPVREKILDKVKSGTKLLLFDDNKGLVEALNADKQLKELSLTINKFGAVKEYPYLAEKYYRFGEGTIGILKYQMDNRRGYLITRSNSNLHYEYKFRRIAGIIYKLAKGIETGSIESVTVEDNSFTVKLSDTAEGVLEYVIRNEAYEAVTRRTVAAAKGEKTAPIELPQLPNGEYSVECVLSRDGKVEDWISTLFVVDRNPGFASAKLDREIFRENDPLVLDLEYSGDIQNKGLRVRFIDAFGRVYSDSSFPIPLAKIEMEVPAGSLSVYNEIKLSLKDGARLLDGQTLIFTLPRKAVKQDFYVLIWGIGGETVKAKKYLQALYDYGVAGAANCGWSEETARSLARFNLRGIPYTIQIARFLDSQLFSDAWKEKMMQRARTAAKAFAKYAGLGYTLSDEVYLNAFKPEGRFSNSDTVTGLFRKFLKDEYNDIRALNEQWETSYTAFDQIVLGEEKELLKSETNPSPWFDYRMFITGKYMRLHYQFRDQIRKFDDGAKVGYDGCEQFSTYDGYDWYQYTRDLQVNNIYTQYIIKGGFPNKLFNGWCVKSFTGKENIRGGWVNHIDPVRGVKYTPWYLALCQFDSVWWWTGSFLGPEVNAFDIDLKPATVFGKVLETSTEISAGPGTLLHKADFEFSPIAIHYSENNWHASTLASGIGNHINYLGLFVERWFKKPLFGDNKEMLELFGEVESMGHYAVASKNFITLFQDLGHQPRMIARQEIEAGKLIESGYKVLALPFVESLSIEEIEQIKKFVENGGTLIADYRTGIRDKHGKIFSKSPLDEVFGIERSSYELKKRYAQVDIDDNFAGHSYGQIKTLFHNPSLKVVSEKAVAIGTSDDGTPLFIRNEYGDGNALYLNTDIYDYFHSRKKGTEQDFKHIFSNLLLDLAQIRPEYEILVDKAPAPHTELFVYDDGDLDYIGIIRDFFVDDHADFEITVPLHKKSHVYDVRKNEYLGFTDRIKRVLKSGETILIAQSPYRISAVSVSSPKVVKRGDDITFDIGIESEPSRTLSNHTVRVEVFGPDNEIKRHLGRNLYLEKGEGVYTFPIALNDQKGKWRIEVKEIISGKKTTTTFKVKG